MSLENSVSQRSKNAKISMSVDNANLPKHQGQQAELVSILMNEDVSNPPAILLPVIF
ncbi:MAG: hypothetical protein AAGA30_00585 [Planctomycetota bacterium]